MKNAPHLAGGAVIVATAALSLWSFDLLWKRSALEDLPAQPGGWAGAAAIVLCSAAVHELLHAVGFRLFAGVPWRSISLRPSWKKMGFVARAEGPSSRAATALPALVMGALPIAIGCAIGQGLVLLWGLFFLLECFADLGELMGRR